MTYGPDTKFLSPDVFERMSAKNLADFDEIGHRLSYFSTLQDARAAAADVLIAGTKTVETIVAVIENFALRYKDNPYGIAAGFDADAHGQSKRDLANLLRFGVETRPPHWQTPNVSNDLVSLAAVKATLAALPSLTLRTVNAALDGMPRPHGPAVSAPVVDYLPPTTDAVEILRRALDPHAYTAAGNSTIGVGTPSELATTASRNSALQAAQADKTLARVDPDILTVLYRTGHEGDYDVPSLAGLTLAEFVPQLTAGGAPGDGTVRS